MLHKQCAVHGITRAVVNQLQIKLISFECRTVLMSQHIKTQCNKSVCEKSSLCRSLLCSGKAAQMFQGRSPNGTIQLLKIYIFIYILSMSAPSQKLISLLLRTQSHQRCPRLCLGEVKYSFECFACRHEIYYLNFSLSCSVSLVSPPSLPPALKKAFQIESYLCHLLRLSLFTVVSMNCFSSCRRV